MRWILCGKNDAAVHALERGVAEGDEVWAIGASGDDGEDGWQRSLRGAAHRLGARFDAPPRINDAAFADRLAEFGARVLVSIQYDQILKAPLFERLGIPCVNFHFALLPRHRGVAPIAWAILEGDDEAGVTLHHMVPAIDAGDVVARRAVPIGAGDSAREVYDHVAGAARELFDETYPLGDELLSRRLGQDDARACYHRAGDLDFGERRIDWSRAAEDLHRWIRAWIFPPMQLPETRVAGRTLAVRRLAPEIGVRVSEPPGTIVDVGDGFLDVAAGDRCLRVLEWCDVAGDELPELSAGDRFSGREAA